MRPGRAFLAALGRELGIAWRRRGELLQPLLFAALICAMLPLALGPEAARLRPMAGGMAWIAALLAGLLGLEALFRRDAEEGVLDQLLLAAVPLPLLFAAKLLAHWLAFGLPLALLAPLLALWLGLPPAALPTLLAGLLLGTPLLSAIGGVAAALTVGIRGSGILLVLLVAPLYLPVLIFGAGAVEASLSGLPARQPLMFLAAALPAAAVFAPWAGAKALRAVAT
ncbi:MAG: heme exporter protein CcmB [Xanthomonadales bacterium]|nr:heme exporter protein CcmB [Xanthomonadales bacterium]